MYSFYSGCVTSAESVLISQQSTDDLFSEFEKNKSLDEKSKKIFVVSIEPQPATDFASKYNISLTQAYMALCGFFKNELSFDYVFDCGKSQSLSLELFVEEVEKKLHSSSQKEDFTNIPLISGVCPGVVCYIEKTHPQLIPLLISSPSVQHVQGIAVKYLLSRHLNIRPKNIYHVCIAPCFDRKIEALRFTKDAPLIDGDGLLLLLLLCLICSYK